MRARAREAGGDVITDDICEFHAVVCEEKVKFPTSSSARHEGRDAGRPLRDAPINLGGR